MLQAVKPGAYRVDTSQVTSPVPTAPRQEWHARGWLVRDELDRRRLRDMNGRVRTARRIQGASCGGATALSSIWYGWWVITVAAAALVTLVVLDRCLSRMVHPERGSIISIAVFVLMISTVVAGTGGARSPFVGISAVPMVMLAARFRPQIVAIGCALALAATAGAFAAATFLPPPAPVPYLVPVVIYLALLASLLSAVAALMTAELASRGEAVVDPLTGLFNRTGLRIRFEEAAAQARVLGQPVSVVMCDLDHFKLVNDTYGHERGDAVLRAVADELRATLRSLDLVYRVGGEEFLVLLPGHDEPAALRVAQRLVEGMAREPLAGLRVTLSAGCATARGDDVEYTRQVRAADTALYAAKAGGRNQARAAGPVVPARTIPTVTTPPVEEPASPRA